MVITQTPVRISFLGGGTDYPAYFRTHGGATLATSINKYTLVSVHHLTEFADHSIRVHYSKVESVEHLAQIKHPPSREGLRFLNLEKGVEIHYVSDLPARTGLGSSSSATVGLLMALHAFKGNMVSREQVAAEAVHVEQNLIKERVGSQDQYACALGGLMHLQFRPDDTVRADPIPLRRSRRQMLEQNLMLFYTGIRRYAHQVLDEQLERTHSGQNTDYLAQLMTLVDQGIEALTSDNNLAEFGALLHDGWMLKRRLSSKITNPAIDDMYQRARQAGAIGGKLLGAGGGGFLLLYVEPAQQEAVRKTLSEVREVNFAFETFGTQVIFYRT